ncbi:MAG TPA: peptidoglycan-binding domain-containing protein [Patescibacteria group bacterium]|nr:peptidoglycan-binding domain-containing protein [Patescibacteria group bacterium]
MRFRRIEWAVLPAILMAITMLAPGLRAATRHHRVKHEVTKAHLHAVPHRHAAHTATRRKISQAVPSRKAKSRRSRRWHRRHIRYRIPARRPSPDRIDQIQQALARNGFYQGDPSGRWDSSTVEAMKSFQQAHDLAPTGKIDAKSLQQLGLGSDVAGLAPPQPLIAADRPGPSE